jgi:hypothetical protein
VKEQTCSHFILLDKWANRIYIPLRHDFTYQSIRHGRGATSPTFSFSNNQGYVVLSIETSDEELDDAEAILEHFTNGGYNE